MRADQRIDGFAGFAGAGGQHREKSTAMAILDDVRKLIMRLSPTPICDDCVADRLGMSARQHANHKTRELAGTSGFERRRDICSLCYDEKLVTRWLKPGH